MPSFLSTSAEDLVEGYKKYAGAPPINAATVKIAQPNSFFFGDLDEIIQGYIDFDASQTAPEIEGKYAYGAYDPDKGLRQDPNAPPLSQEWIDMQNRTAEFAQRAAYVGDMKKYEPERGPTIGVPGPQSRGLGLLEREQQRTQEIERQKQKDWEIDNKYIGLKFAKMIDVPATALTEYVNTFLWGVPKMIAGEDYPTPHSNLAMAAGAVGSLFGLMGAGMTALARMERVGVQQSMKPLIQKAFLKKAFEERALNRATATFGEAVAGVTPFKAVEAIMAKIFKKEATTLSGKIATSMGKSMLTLATVNAATEWKGDNFGQVMWNKLKAGGEGAITGLVFGASNFARFSQRLPNLAWAMRFGAVAAIEDWRKGTSPFEGWTKENFLNRIVDYGTLAYFTRHATSIKDMRRELDLLNRDKREFNNEVAQDGFKVRLNENAKEMYRKIQEVANRTGAPVVPSTAPVPAANVPTPAPQPPASAPEPKPASPPDSEAEVIDRAYAEFESRSPRPPTSDGFIEWLNNRTEYTNKIVQEWARAAGRVDVEPIPKGGEIPARYTAKERFDNLNKFLVEARERGDTAEYNRLLEQVEPLAREVAEEEAKQPPVSPKAVSVPAEEGWLPEGQLPEGAKRPTPEPVVPSPLQALAESSTRKWHNFGKIVDEAQKAALRDAIKKNLVAYKGTGENIRFRRRGDLKAYLGRPSTSPSLAVEPKPAPPTTTPTGKEAARGFDLEAEKAKILADGEEFKVALSQAKVGAKDDLDFRRRLANLGWTISARRVPRGSKLGPFGKVRTLQTQEERDAHNAAVIAKMRERIAAQNAPPEPDEKIQLEKRDAQLARQLVDYPMASAILAARAETQAKLKMLGSSFGDLELAQQNLDYAKKLYAGEAAAMPSDDIDIVFTKRNIARAEEALAKAKSELEVDLIHQAAQPTGKNIPAAQNAPPELDIKGRIAESKAAGQEFDLGKYVVDAKAKGMSEAEILKSLEGYKKTKGKKTWFCFD